MKTKTWPTGNRGGVATALTLFLLVGASAGCAHKELLAPCADYKAAAYDPAARPGLIPCDTPQQMHRPPWLQAAPLAVPADTQEG